MARIVIVGARVVGLGAGLLLCRDGHEVTVLERDAQAPPAGAEEIWGTWQRKGVSQLRLPHFFLARYRGLLDSELPEVKKESAAGRAASRRGGSEQRVAGSAGWRPSRWRLPQARLGPGR